MSFKSGSPCLDTDGHVIDAHGAGLLGPIDGSWTGIVMASEIVHALCSIAYLLGTMCIKRASLLKIRCVSLNRSAPRMIDPRCVLTLWSPSI